MGSCESWQIPLPLASCARRYLSMKDVPSQNVNRLAKKN
jgi:hypothetical protein